MSYDSELEKLLEGMGFTAAQARLAASRYSAANVDAAINFLFSEQAEPPSYQELGQQDSTAASAVQPHPRAAPPLPHINTAQSPIRVPDDDEDDELRRAIEMSKADAGVDAGERDERERSVRASAPPPSPSRAKDEDDADGPALGTLFGPSTKDDTDGKLAMVPAGNRNSEEDEMQRAIEESMMTASFHSASAPEARLPPAAREDGAPVVYYAPKTPPAAPYIIQALAAVPQLRDVFAAEIDPLMADDGAWPPGADFCLFILNNLVRLQRDDATASYVGVDDEVSSLVDSWTARDSRLPPTDAITNVWLERVSRALENLPAASDSSLSADFSADRARLFRTALASDGMPVHTHVSFFRDGLSAASDVHAALAGTLWHGAAPSSVRLLADVLSVVLKRAPGVAAKPWKLEQRVTLDRYLTENERWAVQLRADMSSVRGEVSRLRSQIDVLKTYKGHDVANTLGMVRKYLETAPTRDDVQAETMRELAAKLEAASAKLAEKVAKLEADIAAREPAANGALFDDAPPEHCLHNYELRAVLWHDGFTTPGRHLYAYIRSEADWWRVQDHEIAKVEWDAVAQDSTGQFTDGGPYLLVYSRDGPRPPAPTPEPEPDAGRAADAPPPEYSAHPATSTPASSTLADGGDAGSPLDPDKESLGSLPQHIEHMDMQVDTPTAPTAPLHPSDEVVPQAVARTSQVDLLGDEEHIGVGSGQAAAAATPIAAGSEGVDDARGAQGRPRAPDTDVDMT